MLGLPLWGRALHPSLSISASPSTNLCILPSVRLFVPHWGIKSRMDMQELGERVSQKRLFCSLPPQRSTDSEKSSGTSGEAEVSTEVWTIPNIITFSRIASAPLLTVFIYQDMKVAALCGVMAAGVSDWLDGYLARQYGMASVLGAFVDPIADKVLIGCVAMGLTLKGLLPVPLASLIVLRDLALVGSAFYIRHQEKKESEDYYDPKSLTFQIKPSLISKVRTSLC